MYHLATLLLFAFAAPLGVFAQIATTLSYDNNYDNADLSLNSVACSAALESKGYTTLGSLPNFPNVGAAYTVTNGNSPSCGACYAVTYNNVTLNILAVDVAKTGFTVSETAMNDLTDDQAVYLGRVDVTYVEVDASVCGLKN